MFYNYYGLCTSYYKGSNHRNRSIDIKQLSECPGSRLGKFFNDAPIVTDNSDCDSNSIESEEEQWETAQKIGPNTNKTKTSGDEEASPKGEEQSSHRRMGGINTATGITVREDETHGNSTPICNGSGDGGWPQGQLGGLSLPTGMRVGGRRRRERKQSTIEYRMQQLRIKVEPKEANEEHTSSVERVHLDTVGKSISKWNKSRASASFARRLLAAIRSHLRKKGVRTQ